MKFIKNILFDFRQGILENKALFLFPILITTFTFFDFILRVQGFNTNPNAGTYELHYGDCWFYLYGGMKEYIPEPGNPFQFPIIWMTVFVTVPFLVLNYPLNDLLGIGQQVLLRSKGRSFWWLSKCCWNLSATLLYHVLIMLTLLFLCLIWGIPITNHFDMSKISIIFGFIPDTSIEQAKVIPLLALALPTLISMAINTIQITASLFIKPIFSFLAVAAWLISSAYLLKPYFIGNYAMPIRYNWMIPNGLLYTKGFILAVIMIALSILIGIIRFRSYDIIKKGD